MPIFRSATGHDAAAMLLRTTHTVAMTSPSVPGMSSADSTEYVSTVTDRLGDLIIEDGAVSRIVTDNGFAVPDGGSFDYCFYVTDHQGNNRMVIDENGTVHRIEHYYPFGLSFEVANFTSRGTTSRRSFGGKEFDRISGLDLYDQEARQYDPALLRFTRPDDLGDKYLPLSPFAFCLNNPVLLTDPSGQFTLINSVCNFSTNTLCIYSRESLDDRIIRKDYDAANAAGMPILIVDDITDLNVGLNEVNSVIATTIIVITNHGKENGNFEIGSTLIENNSDLSELRPAVEGKTVVIKACEVGAGESGETMTINLSKSLNTTVITSEHNIPSGYIYNGSKTLNQQRVRPDSNIKTLKSFLISVKGSRPKRIYNVSIDKIKGIEWDIKEK